jgi:hypothetical protein
MNVALLAVMKALDAIGDLDACSREDKIQAARKILERAPASLPHDVAQWVAGSGPKLNAKLRRDSMGNKHRLDYVVAVASNGPTAPAPKKPGARGVPEADEYDADRAEKKFIRQVLAEIREADAELVRKGPGRERRAQAVNAWMNDRSLPTPHWALGGFGSPDEYEMAKRRPLRSMSAPEPERAKRVEPGPSPLGDALDMQTLEEDRLLADADRRFGT